LIAPLAMLIQTTAVAGILAGRDSGWNTQRRDDGRVPLAEVWASYWRYMVFGLILAAAAWAVSPSLFLWMTPVLLGLTLAVPLAGLTANRGPGQFLGRLGLLRIPEERTPPAILSRAATLVRELEAHKPADPWKMLLSDPALLNAHRAMLPAPRRPGQGPLDDDLVLGMARLSEAPDLPGGLAALSVRERAAVLASADGLDRLEALYRGVRPGPA
jgi:membrane glycosyltransferase